MMKKLVFFVVSAIFILSSAGIVFPRVDEDKLDPETITTEELDSLVVIYPDSSASIAGDSLTINDNQTDNILSSLFKPLILTVLLGGTLLVLYTQRGR